MRRLSTAFCALALTCLAAPAFGAEAASPVFNGRFEIFVGGVGLLDMTPVGGEGLGVGHQLYCTQAGALAWGADCRGAPVDRAALAQDIAADPARAARREADLWTQRGYHDDDVGMVAPARANVWHAANWEKYPFNGVEFRDVDFSGDREARFTQNAAVLYQSYGPTSTHTLVPMGSVQAVSFRLEEGAPSGLVRLLLDSFPAESATDYPLFFYNYQLVLPTFAWRTSGNMVVIDPTDGVLLGPSSSSYAVADADAHPNPTQWAKATKEERREILMELRAIQLAFQSMDAGTVIDDVAMTLIVEDPPAEEGAETLTHAAS